jgi:hypothetical protein
MAQKRRRKKNSTKRAEDDNFSIKKMWQWVAKAAAETNWVSDVLEEETMMKKGMRCR